MIRTNVQTRQNPGRLGSVTGHFAVAALGVVLGVGGAQFLTSSAPASSQPETDKTKTFNVACTVLDEFIKGTTTSNGLDARGLDAGVYIPVTKKDGQVVVVYSRNCSYLPS